MDINSTRCIKHPPTNTDITERCPGARDDTSEPPQTDLFRLPRPLTEFDSGNDKLPDVRLDYHLQATLLSLAASLKPNINNLLRKR